MTNDVVSYGWLWLVISLIAITLVISIIVLYIWSKHRNMSFLAQTQEKNINISKIKGNKAGFVPEAITKEVNELNEEIKYDDKVTIENWKSDSLLGKHSIDIPLRYATELVDREQKIIFSKLNDMWRMEKFTAYGYTIVALENPRIILKPNKLF